jgi:hypothetical protein
MDRVIKVICLSVVIVKLTLFIVELGNVLRFEINQWWLKVFWLFVNEMNCLPL